MPKPKRTVTGPRGRRRKVRKSIAVGNAYIKTSFNNTLVTLTDKEGNVISWASAGSAGLMEGTSRCTAMANANTPAAANSEERFMISLPRRKEATRRRAAFANAPARQESLSCRGGALGRSRAAPNVAYEPVRKVTPPFFPRQKR